MGRPDIGDNRKERKKMKDTIAKRSHNGNGGFSLLYLINNYPFPLLAQSFLRSLSSTNTVSAVAQGFLMNYDLFPFLARSFFRIQGLGRIQSGAVLLYCEYLNLGRKRSSRKKNPLKKTKPIQSQFKPKQSQFFGGFWRTNFNFSLKIDDTKLNFLCKTKPIYENSILSTMYHFNEKMQNEPNLNIILTFD